MIATLSPQKIFQPTLPARGATRFASQWAAPNPFQPTLPARGATMLAMDAVKRVMISTHAPRTGSDAVTCITMLSTASFQPTLPARGATDAAIILSDTPENFNPRSPHGERRHIDNERMRAVHISTHAPRTGSDLFPPATPRWQAISNHAPRTGSDTAPHRQTRRRPVFQPTLPARGATRFARYARWT